MDTREHRNVSEWMNEWTRNMERSFHRKLHGAILITYRRPTVHIYALPTQSIARVMRRSRQIYSPIQSPAKLLATCWPGRVNRRVSSCPLQTVLSMLSVAGHRVRRRVRPRRRNAVGDFSWAAERRRRAQYFSSVYRTQRADERPRP
jgi:hypothetical protein